MPGIQCLILAGGLGTRMAKHAANVPKNLIEVHGKPFAHYQLSWLKKAGVTDIVYSIGYLGDLIRDYVGSGAAWSLSVEYVDEGDELRGTGGAVRFAYEAGVLSDEFFVMYGDSFLPIDFRPVMKAFRLVDKPALMTVFKNDGRWDKSNCIYENGMVVLYDKNGRGAGVGGFDFIDYGLSVLSKQMVNDYIPPGRKFDIAEAYNLLSRQGELAGFEVNERFYEIGSPCGLKDFSGWVLKKGSLI
ncbi:MAG: sugar phosphate nucleotidyltransferase [Bdellovibrionota bacterium]